MPSGLARCPACSPGMESTGARQATERTDNELNALATTRDAEMTKAMNALAAAQADEIKLRKAWRRGNAYRYPAQRTDQKDNDQNLAQVHLRQCSTLYCRSASAGAYTSGLHTDNTLGTTRGRLEHTSTTTHSSRVTWCITEPKVAHRP